jgi:hypothetical protein
LIFPFDLVASWIRIKKIFTGGASCKPAPTAMLNRLTMLNTALIARLI